MSGFKDLFSSTRGVMSIVIIIAATVLVGLNKLSSVEWLVLTGGTGGAFIAGKTATDITEIKSARPSVTVTPASSPSGQTVVVNTDGGAA